MQRVFVTGANRGIGLGLVRHLLTRGDRIFAGCRSPEQAVELNRQQELYGSLLNVLPLDVTNQAAIDSVSAVVKGFTDSLDILFNNAGVGGGEDPFGKITEKDLVSTFRVNAAAPLMLAQAFLPLLKKGNRPVIVNVTSRMGSIADNGSGGSYAYRASKAALNMLNKSMAIDLAGAGIIAVVVHPGWVRTDMGGRQAPLSVDKSVAGILEVVDGLRPKDSGRFLAWDGEEIPW